MTDYAARRTMMVDTQVRPAEVTKFPIISAMLSIPREDFVPSNLRETAYMGENIELDGGRVMLEPRTLSKMLDVLDIQPHELVMDIGCALGYTSALMARLAGAVVAVEEDETMAGEAQSRLTEHGADNVILHRGPLVQGAAQHGPFDAIAVQGAVSRMPDAIIDQLKEGGRMACLFMEEQLGAVRVGYKIDGQMTWRFAFNAGAPVLPGFERPKAFAL